MLLGEKVGPYIRPNPTSFTGNLDQDRIGRINWDETGYKDLVSEESMGSRMEVIYKRGKPVRADKQEIAVRVYKYDGKRYQLRKSYDKFIPFKQ
jgi:hypothetical protein